MDTRVHGGRMTDPVPDQGLAAAVLRYQRPLELYALRIVGNVERARDVVQETFAKLLVEDQGRLDGHLVQWLYTVCRHKALDVRRKERRMQTMTDEQADAFVCDSAGPDDVAETRESSLRVLRLLDRLPASQQEVIRLKFQHGLSYRQISQVTGHSESNVGFLVHMGLKTLREQCGRR